MAGCGGKNGDLFRFLIVGDVCFCGDGIVAMGIAGGVGGVLLFEEGVGVDGMLVLRGVGVDGMTEGLSSVGVDGDSGMT